MGILVGLDNEWGIAITEETGLKRRLASACRTA